MEGEHPEVPYFTLSVNMLRNTSPANSNISYRISPYNLDTSFRHRVGLFYDGYLIDFTYVPACK